MTRVPTRTNVAFVLVCLLGLAVPAAAQTPPKPTSPPLNELDAFMEKVLKRREQNRQVLQQYVLDEAEQVEVLGPGRMPLFRQRRDYTWYVRDGLHVRSPVRFDGVTVGDAERKEYEDSWAKRERGRLEAKAKNAKDDKKSKDDKAETAEPPPSDDAAGPAGASPIPTPRFVSEAYFMDFKFERGNYYLAGREQLEGQTVLRIEYYPTRMFNDDDEKENDEQKQRTEKNTEKEGRGQRRAKETEQRIERQMNKTALVTLWVDPAEHQIVKYTFDNVWMDFLPGGWLVRVDDIRASMTMGQPFPGVWLPRDMNVHAGVTVASGSLEAAYSRKFSDYKQAETTTLIRIPKIQAPHPPSQPQEFPEPDASGPFVAEVDVQAEVVTEIRVHGNAYLRDDEVIRLAGISLGQPIQPDTLRAIEQRLKTSGFFETVEIRKRYRSLDSLTDVAIVLLVHEREGQKSDVAIEPPSIWPWSRVKSRLMFMPILGYDDGYGFTYGGRVSTIGLLGMKERLSVPLTWGGTRRAAVEFERTFKTGPLTRVASTFGISQRENPRFDVADRRIAWTGRAERSFAGIVRAGVDTSLAKVKFRPFDDRLWTLGADAALDTRGDPAFPRNAVFLGASWTGLHVDRLDERINRYTTDARGYLGVVRQAVVAGRIEYSTADRTLPPYERLLLGGASSLRGFRAGAFDGDRRLLTSAELRVPISSVLSGAKLGLTAFVDAAKTFDAGQSAKDAPWHRGVGGGVFLIATIVRINFDVAHGLKDGDTRVHLSSGFSF